MAMNENARRNFDSLRRTLADVSGDIATSCEWDLLETWRVMRRAAVGKPEKEDPRNEMLQSLSKLKSISKANKHLFKQVLNRFDAGVGKAQQRHAAKALYLLESIEDAILSRDVMATMVAVYELGKCDLTPRCAGRKPEAKQAKPSSQKRAMRQRKAGNPK